MSEKALEPAVPQGDELRRAVCWECGQERDCIEYVVCCTGTLFHVCPECEENVNALDQGDAGPCSTETG